MGHSFPGWEPMPQLVQPLECHCDDWRLPWTYGSSSPEHRYTFRGVCESEMDVMSCALPVSDLKRLTKEMVLKEKGLTEILSEFKVFTFLFHLVKCIFVWLVSLNVDVKHSTHDGKQPAGRQPHLQHPCRAHAVSFNSNQ